MNPPDPSQPGGLVALFDFLYDAAGRHDRIAIVAALLIALMALVRWALPKIHGGVGAFVNGSIGKPLTVLFLGELGSVVTALGAGKCDAHTLLRGGVVAFVASGGYSLLKPFLDRFVFRTPASPYLGESLTTEQLAKLQGSHDPDPDKTGPKDK